VPHFLLQVRCAVLNGDLLAPFRRWFPTVGERRIMLPWIGYPTNKTVPTRSLRGAYITCQRDANIPTIVDRNAGWLGAW
jgi:hypothetical protein